MSARYTQPYKLTQLSAAILLALAAGQVGAADNSITLEQAGGGNGTGNFADITATGTNKTVSIYQVGSGDGSTAAKSNQVGTSGSSLILPGAGVVTAHIGQGGFWTDGTPGSWTKGTATKGNLVSGTITSGTVNLSQSSDNNTATLNVDGSGVVTIKQGYANAAGGGGSGHTATVTQASTGAVTIEQGNKVGSASSGLTATVTQNGAGAVTVKQGETHGTSGSATVVHAGSHTVAITQDRADAGSLGVIKTNTSGNDGSLTITHGGAGNTFVNASGDTNNGASAVITGTAALTNNGSGTLALTNAFGTVTAKINGAGTVKINNIGVNNQVFVDSVGDGTGSAITNGGLLTLNSDGANNTIKVASYSAGITTVNQDVNMEGSTLALSGGHADSNAVLYQNGDFQNATVVSANGSIGNFYLNPVGTDGTHLAAVNLTY